MRIFILIPFIAFYSQSAGQNYSKEDTINIYHLITSLPKNNGALIYNDLYNEFDTLDIDGNLEGWAQRKQRSQHYGELGPILFSLSLAKYLDSIGEYGNKSYLLEQLKQIQPDRLENYWSAKHAASKTNYIWINSTQKKLMRQNFAIGMGNILFTNNNIAFVKVAHLSLKKSRHLNYSEIVVLKKKNFQWNVTAFLEEKINPY